MIVIYAPQITNRIKYAFDLVLCQILGTSIRLTSDISEFYQHKGVKINYSDTDLDASIKFTPAGLLAEKEIVNIEIDYTEKEGVPGFFQVQDGAFSFDPFAAAFYLVTRYEEYINNKRDHYQRFIPQESVAYKNGFLKKPVVNIWALKIQEMIEQKYPDYQFPQRKYKFITTIDVDNAYAYLEKGFVRTLGAIARSLLQLNLGDLVKRIKCLINIEKDPFDTFDVQLEIQKKYGLKAIYFFLVADYGLNDKNVPVTSRKFQALIKHIGDYAEIGIHPSFASNEEPEKFRIEIKRLSGVVHHDINHSRQHFLKLTLPDTYRNLSDCGITDDYTMGYASEPGFRAGICSPFYFYDLERDMMSALKIHPFCVMEATFMQYKAVSAIEAMKEIKAIIDEVKAVKGTFMSLWHNDSLSEMEPWNGWSRLYEDMVKEAQ